MTNRNANAKTIRAEPSQARAMNIRHTKINGRCVITTYFIPCETISWCFNTFSGQTHLNVLKRGDGVDLIKVHLNQHFVNSSQAAIFILLAAVQCEKKKRRSQMFDWRKKESATTKTWNTLGLWLVPFSVSNKLSFLWRTTNLNVAYSMRCYIMKLNKVHCQRDHKITSNNFIQCYL